MQQNNIKAAVQNLYDDRQDDWANKEAAKLSGIIDLHATDAQYTMHVNCSQHLYHT